ncbi:MAG TPA: PilZ domain-containing protein [Polyangiaceae bacterium]
MNALHRVESSRGVGTGEAAAGALVLVRQALSQLQSGGVPHPAVDQAMEAIAGSLGLVHQLSVLVGQASVAPSPPTQPSGAYQAYPEPKPQVAVVGQPQAYQPPAQQPQPAQGWAQPQQPAAPAWQQPPAAQPAAAWQQQPQAAAAPAWQQPPAQQPAHAPQAAAWQNPALHAPHAAPGGEAVRVEAALGAHSATNFYKGLSGNDVIDSGGIFVATYSIPQVGQKLVIKVSMPGGYEFEALGEVKWTRDAPNSGADSSPGFGAQFTQISPEARQLVYRYVRNREPLFHDDF